MTNEPLRYSATDKEIYDVLMSSKKRMNDEALHEMAKARGIFYSPRDSREALASQLSLLPHDYEALSELLGQSENPSRAEKVTSVTLNATLSTDDIKAVCSTFKDNAPPDEKVLTHVEGPGKFVMQVQYSEIDYSKTRLLQRRLREADIKIVTEGEKTTIRMPANPKAREIVTALKSGLDARKKADIPAELIELCGLDADGRTAFFTSLISKLSGFKVQNVTNVDVQSSVKASDAGDPDVEEGQADNGEAEAAEEMLSVVENVALKGQILLASTEYQHLREEGFYITSITWISQQTEAPYHRIEFEAGFEEPEEGKSFRYNVRGIYRNQGGEFTKTRRQVTSAYKQGIFPILERAAHQVLASLRKKSASPDPASVDGAE